MGDEHPHADATYRVIALDGGAFGVEVEVQDSFPTMVTGLASRQAADDWITGHKTRVSSQSSHNLIPRSE